MKLNEWETDVRNRQRNIVFPDTVLNEARLFRNLFSSRQRTPMQIAGVIVFAGMFFVLGVLAVAYTLAGLANARTMADWIFAIALFPGLGMIGFSIIVLVRSFSPGQLPLRKVRRGYRKSNQPNGR